MPAWREGGCSINRSPVEAANLGDFIDVAGRDRQPRLRGEFGTALTLIINSTKPYQAAIIDLFVCVGQLIPKLVSILINTADSAIRLIEPSVRQVLGGGVHSLVKFGYRFFRTKSFASSRLFIRA